MLKLIPSSSSPDDKKKSISKVQYMDKQEPAVHIAEAKKEVILCCGALRTPHILMLSGIGPK